MKFDLFTNPFERFQRDFLFVCATILISSCGFNDDALQPDDFKMSVRGEAQGTTYNVVYYDLQQRNLKASIDSLLNRIDESISTYREGSVIDRWNKSDSGAVVDSLFIHVLRESWTMYKASDGAFDPTVKPLVSYWGFGPERFDGTAPIDLAQLESLRQLIGFDSLKIQLPHATVSLEYFVAEDMEAEEVFLRKYNPGMQLDFNAIGQGWSADRIARFLKSRGIKIFFVELGGEIACGDPKPDGSHWTFGIDKPVDSAARELQAVIQLRNRGMATSGNYRKFYVKDGVRYAHTIHPATGRPVQHSLLSATVVGSNAAEADAMATAFMVMGKDSAQHLLRAKDYLGVYVYFVYDSAGVWKTYTSPELVSLIEER